jgi:hypothetical protein
MVRLKCVVSFFKAYIEGSLHHVHKIAMCSGSTLHIKLSFDARDHVRKSEYVENTCFVPFYQSF